MEITQQSAMYSPPITIFTLDKIRDIARSIFDHSVPSSQMILVLLLPWPRPSRLEANRFRDSVKALAMAELLMRTLSCMSMRTSCHIERSRLGCVSGRGGERGSGHVGGPRIEGAQPVAGLLIGDQL